MTITLLGLGMGTPDTLTLDGCAALVRADAVIGAARLLEDLPDGVTANRVAMIQPGKIVDWIETHGELTEICVVFSGDTGFYSGATQLYPLLATEDSAAQGRLVELQPGIATPAYLCARAGIPWQGVHLVSAHGRGCDPLAHLLNHPQCFYLTGGDWTPGNICAAFTEAGLGDTEILVGVRLSYPDEKLTAGTAAELAGKDFPALSAMLATRKRGSFCYSSRAGGIPDEMFQRGEVPMTKREARAVILSMLAPCEGDILWDVGAGTGSVAVELALVARWGRVFAVERGEKGCALIRENRERFGVYNLCCVEGLAPAACESLPAPDAVFVGGSAGNLRAIMELAVAKNPTVRVVISAVTIETMSRGLEALKSLGFLDIDAVQISASRAQAVGPAHLLRAMNPIFVMSGRGAGE